MFGGWVQCALAPGALRRTWVGPIWPEAPFTTLTQRPSIPAARATGSLRRLLHAGQVGGFVHPRQVAQRTELSCHGSPSRLGLLQALPLRESRGTGHIDWPESTGRNRLTKLTSANYLKRHNFRTGISHVSIRGSISLRLAERKVNADYVVAATRPQPRFDRR